MIVELDSSTRLFLQASSPLTSTPRKASTPFQLWREEHLRQEAGLNQSEASVRSRDLSGPIREKHPPTRAYIEEEPDKRVETYQRWRQQQRENRLSASGHKDPFPVDTRHLSELERQIEAVQRSERESTLSAESETTAAMTASTAAVAAVKSKKKDKRSSLSSLLNVFKGKKSKDTAAPTPPLKKKKSSLGAMMEREGVAASVLDPSAHKRIIEEQPPTNQRPANEQPANQRPEPERAKSPYQLWREKRASSERQDPSDISELQSQTGFSLPVPRPGSLRTPTPDPDYDNLSYKSANSPRAPRAPREHPSFDDNSSDTGSYEDHGGGRYTPRSSNASEYGRNIPRYQPMPNLIMGYGRGRVSPSLSETSIGGHQAKRSPSTESFFGKNGANVSQTGSSSQLWYQKYKHSSFSAAQQTSQSGVFGDPLYGAFDGRISKFRGKIILVTSNGAVTRTKQKGLPIWYVYGFIKIFQLCEYNVSR